MAGRKRLRTALLLGLLVIGAAIPMVGLAGVDSGQAPSQVVGPGHRASYAVMPVTEEAADLDFVLYEWMPQQLVFTREFAQVVANPLLARYVFGAGGWQEHTAYREYFFDAIDGTLLYTTWEGTSRIQPYLAPGMIGHVGVGLDQATQPPRIETFLSAAYDGASSPCGIWAPGRSIPCATQVDGGMIVPFPTEMIVAEGELFPDADAEAYYRLVRTGFASDGAAYGVPTTRGPSPGAVPLASTTPWLIDEAGLQFEFSLAQAYAAVIEGDAFAIPQCSASPLQCEPAQLDYGEWIELHPEAYLAMATLHRKPGADNQETAAWRLLWSDGSAWLAKEVTPLALDGGEVVVTDWTPVDPQRPPEAEVPTTLPTLAVAAHRYQLMAYQAPTNLVYGFDIACEDGNCTAAKPIVWIGQQSYNGTPTDLAGWATHIEQVAIDAEGLLLERRSASTSQGAALWLGDGTGGSPAATGKVPGSHWTIQAAPTTVGIGLAALVAGLYYAWPSLRMVAVGLFSRTADDELLEHPRRAAVHQAIVRNPGIHFKELCRLLQLGRGATQHHLDKLLAAKLLTKVKRSGYVCYFPAGTQDASLMHASSALRSPSARAVFDGIRRSPGIAGKDLAAAVGLARSTVSYHISQLQQVGLVTLQNRDTRLTLLGERLAAHESASRPATGTR